MITGCHKATLFQPLRNPTVTLYRPLSHALFSRHFLFNNRKCHKAVQSSPPLSLLAAHSDRLEDICDPQTISGVV